MSGRYTSQSRVPPDDKTGSKRKYQYEIGKSKLPLHLSEFQNVWRQCEYYYKEGINLKTYVNAQNVEFFYV